MANRPQTAIAPADATDVAEGVLRLPSLALHHGGVLRDVQLAWRMTGPADAPCVVVMGGISGHRRVFGPPGEERGWWQEVAGEGGSFPSDRVRMLAFDYLGGSGATTGPRPDHVPGAFPTVSSHDQAVLLALLLDHLGIDAVDAIAGASYGGMVALAFAQRNAARVRRLLVVSAADRTDPMSTAWRSMQREVLRFAISCGRGADGLRLARAMAMSTYRSRSEFAQRFDGEARRASPDARLTFPVEEYLLARGDDYARRYFPGGFLVLSESIDLHRVDAASIVVPVDAVAVEEDQLVPVADVRAMVERLPRGRLHVMSSHYGHDTFLKESDKLRPFFAGLLPG
jgi:homoserine O-acetyltransferase